MSLLPLLLLTTAALTAEPSFVDVTAEVGVDFQHQDGRSGRRYFIETVASGGGFLDFDGDGDLDIYLLNGAATPGSKLKEPPRNALFENRGGRFVEVAKLAGVDDDGYGMGFCVGDADGDGRLDFFVTNVGPDRLFQNLGEGRFEEVAVRAGVDGGKEWSVGCAFGDIDGDGDLDLYVSRYVEFSFEGSPKCSDRARGLDYYCHPSRFAGRPDALFINRGDGTFSDRSAERGIRQESTEKGLGVVLADLDLDGDLDLYVANDGTPNRLYLSDGSGRFKDASLLSGAALGEAGEPLAGMGVAFGDVDGDGLEDLLVSNFSLEPNSFYKNLGDGLFEDRTRAAGLHSLSYRPLGWGIELFDADNDGDLDLAVANGHVMDNIERFVPGATYAQPDQLFLNEGLGHFREVKSVGPWQQAAISRGLASGDFNNDGRLDLLVTRTNGAPALLENRTPHTHSWLGLVLVGPPSNRQAIGARVVLRAGKKSQVRQVRSGGGVLSQSDLRLHFGLGEHQCEVEVHIRWPDGSQQIEKTTQLDRYWPIVYKKPTRP